MIQYDNTVPGIFLRRVNRFVAEVQIAWYGCQVEKICDPLKADNLPKPEYSVHPGDIMI